MTIVHSRLTAILSPVILNAAHRQENVRAWKVIETRITAVLNMVCPVVQAFNRNKNTKVIFKETSFEKKILPIVSDLQ